MILFLLAACAPEADSAWDAEWRDAEPVEANPASLEKTELVDHKSGTVSKGSSNYVEYKFYKYKGYDYDIDVEAVSGSCTAYGMYDKAPTKSVYHKKGDAYDDFGWEDTTTNGYYYVRIYASSSSSCKYEYNVWRSS